MAQSYDLVSDEQMTVGMLIGTKILSPPIQILAIIANVLNIWTFFRIGLKDGVNVTFMALSLTDLGYVLLDMLNTISLIIALSPWQQDIALSMYSLTGCLLPYQYMFLETSTSLETYLAITRCCCVVLPLRFKNVFTLRRSAIVIAVAFLCNVVFRIPLLTSYGLSPQTSPATNVTKITIYFSSSYPLFSMIEQIAGRTLFPLVFLIIAGICSVILTSSLISMSQKRKAMTSANVGEEKLHVRKSDQSNEVHSYNHVTTKTLKSKEVQLVKAVTLVTILQGFLLLILSVYSLSEASVWEFFPGRKYRNIHNIILIFINIFITLHAGCKIIIYYNFNTRFREIIQDMFKFKRSPSKKEFSI